MHIRPEARERHTLSVTVDNEAGILARVAGLFSARGYNIESLTVADVTEDEAISRITIVTSGAPAMIEQIIAQLDRLVPVHGVVDLTATGAVVERELALVKAQVMGDRQAEARRLADGAQARALDTTDDAVIFEMTGASDEIDAFLDRMRGIGPVEVTRTGIAAMARGHFTN